MKDYIRIKKKTLAWMAVAAVVVAAAAWYALTCTGGGREPQMVTVHSYNVLKADGKPLLYFRSMGRDSVLTGMTLHHDSIALGCAADTTVTDLHAVVERNREMLGRRLRELDSIADEMDYYLNVHNVQDEGYDMVVAHKDVIERETAAVGEMMDVLSGIDAGTGLETEYVAVTVREDSLDTAPVFMADGDGIWRGGIWLKTARRGRGVAFDRSGRAVSGVWHCDTLTTGRRTDDGGTYRGPFDGNLYAAGHGTYEANDGSFYEGHWTADLRDGFGFEVSTGSIRAGEWKDGRYRGERMNYTSDRIYGIDISRYQHGKGKTFYPIHWDRLRITHLGKISRKQVQGVVDYPVSFVYIKSTEGVSVRNQYYAADYRQARRHGIYCGAYHFFSTKTDAAAQARYFIKHTSFSKGDLPPVLDVEPTHAQIMRMGGEEALLKAIRTWMTIVRRHTGVRPVLYVNQTFVNRYLVNAPDIKRDYNVWIARYGEYRPDVRLTYWQLSPDGRVNGIHGDVDINVFNGYKDRFDLFLETERIK